MSFGSISPSTKPTGAKLPTTLGSAHVLQACHPRDAAIWTALVDSARTPDVYFRPGYAATYADAHARAIAVVITTSSTRRFLLPLLLRDVDMVSGPGAHREYDALTPYGYGGVLPLDDGSFTESDAEQLIQLLGQWCLGAGVVSCMLRLHPLLAQHSSFRAAAAQSRGGAVTHFGPTAAIDLLDWDPLLNAPTGMKKGRRSDLAHARRHLRVEIASCDTPQAMELLDQFRVIYDATMLRLNARPFYSFSDRYYRSLQQGLSERLAVAVAYHGADPVGAALFLNDHRFGHYHLGGVTQRGRQHKAQTAVLVEGAQWLRGRHCRWLHLGGGRTPGDSLFQFKHSFGANTFHYANFTLIANEKRYSDLTELRRSLTVNTPRPTDFFPAYRATQGE